MTLKWDTVVTIITEEKYSFILRREHKRWGGRPVLVVQVNISRRGILFYKSFGIVHRRFVIFKATIL
jgi:hypothetical protein